MGVRGYKDWSVEQEAGLEAPGIRIKGTISDHTDIIVRKQQTINLKHTCSRKNTSMFAPSYHGLPATMPWVHSLLQHETTFD